MAKKRIIELTIACKTFSLKNLQVHDDMSDETTCFSADLYCNGKEIAHCSNDGHGGSTMVSRPITSMPTFHIYRDAMNAISTIRDEEYEKEINALCKQYSSVGDVAPFVQYWTPEHLCDVLMEKQSDWEDAVKQLKKFAKKQHPDMQIWFNGSRMVACTGDTFASTDGTKYENVTEWVR